MERGSGILLPIFSLPSHYGIGTFGKESRKFIRFLSEAGQKYWQILPLNPTSYGDSPYQSFSAFALNPYFIDLDLLLKDKYLEKEDLKGQRIKGNDVDYGKLYQVRFDVLKVAFKNYNLAHDEKVEKKYQTFIKKNKFWLESYAEFMVLKTKFNGEAWSNWPRLYKRNVRKAVLASVEENKEEYLFWIWIQFIAREQYNKVKKFANKKGVKIIGDMPIYVAMDSADIWAHPHIFQLDKRRDPSRIAGVPPDYFSATGQRWGNPLYNYEAMERNNYSWWAKRVKFASKLYDVIRIDHFRAFDTYWSIDNNCETAIDGEWIKGPGMKLIDVINANRGKTEIIAEDLGDLFDSVKELKEKSKWPGLKIYQFAFEAKSLDDEFLPSNYEENCVAYICTHDNDVLVNYLDEHKDLFPFMKAYLEIGRDEDIHDTLIGSLMRSVARVTILTIQDLLKLGKETRFNTPGTCGTNWKWRLGKNMLTHEEASHLLAMTKESNR